MPSPWKKGRLGVIPRLLVSSLRSKAKRGVGDSSLVVQAGFPTSVADLLVKNRSRLGKPPRWVRHPRPAAPDADARCSTMAALASEIVAAASASADRLPTPPGSPPPEAYERRQCSPVAEKCGDPESPIAAEAPKNGALRGLLRSKVSKDEEVAKVGAFDDLHGPKATGEGVSQGVSGSNAEMDETFQASAQPKAPRIHPLESSPAAEARKGEACEAPPAPEEAERKVLGGVCGGDFMVAAKVAFLVVILAIVSKKIAAAVSAWAFAFLFVESIGRRLIPLVGPCEEATKSLGAIVGAAATSDLLNQTPPGELNSHCWGRIPVLLASIAKTDLGSFHSERNSVVGGPVIARETSSGLEEKDCAEFGGGRGDQEAAIVNGKKKKRKKLFRNFVPMKFLGSKGVKGGKMEGKLAPASDSGVGGVPGQKRIGEEALEDEEEEDGADEGKDEEEEEEEEQEEEGLGLQFSAMAHDVGLGDAASVGINVGEPAKRSSENLVFFVVVLSGLVGGRVVALVLTVLWCLLVSSARSLWRSWTSQRSLGAVPDASTSEALSTGGGE